MEYFITSKTILIVDDSAIMRQMIRSVVENYTDCTVCGEAENGQVAVDLVKSLHPQLVLLDLSMPVMNGLEAARKISAFEPNLPMIMFTMHDGDLLRSEAHRVGIQRVFPKKQTLDGLLEAIRAI